MSAPALAPDLAGSPLVVGGCRLEYRWIPAARASAPTFVLRHEGLGSVGVWRNFPERLAQRTGAGVFLYSRAGYGGSEPGPGVWGTDYLHHEAFEVLPAVLADRGIYDPVLLGHSDGASIALMYAGHGRWSPRALVLEAPHVFIEDVTMRGVSEVRRQYQHGVLRAKLRRWHDDADRVFHRWTDVWQRPEARSWNIEALLPRIRCPALVIQGEDDNYGTLAQVEAIGRQTAGPVDTLVLTRCGHTPHREAEAEVIEEVAYFVARL
jgi:pimeloyl-ACP methyl ester carboxylesterase